MNNKKQVSNLFNKLFQFHQKNILNKKIKCTNLYLCNLCPINLKKLDMKLLPFFLLFFMVQLNAQLSKNDKIITKGIWLIYKGEGKYMGDLSLNKIIFKKDNSYEINTLQNSEIVKGNWEMSTNDKELTIKRADAFDIKYEVILANSNKIILSREDNLTELKKIKANYTLPKKEYPKNLIGSWQIINRNGKVPDAEQYIKLNADGSSIANFTTNEAKWWTRGNLLFLDTGIEDVVEFSLSKKNNELSIVSGNYKMNLVKTDKEVTPLANYPDEE